jgi:hypothetical protein
MPQGVATTNPTPLIPSSATFTLLMSVLLKGDEPLIDNAKCLFSYEWNFTSNIGSAKLISMDDCVINILLSTSGTRDYMDFRSFLDEPFPVLINGKKVVLHNIMLDISLMTGERAGCIVFNKDSAVIQVSSKWDDICHRDSLT